MTEGFGVVSALPVFIRGIDLASCKQPVSVLSAM